MGSFNIVFPRPQSFVSLPVDDQIGFDLVFNLLRQRNKIVEYTKRTFGKKKVYKWEDLNSSVSLNKRINQDIKSIRRNSGILCRTLKHSHVHKLLLFCVWLWEVKSVQLWICERSEFHLLELGVSLGLLFLVFGLCMAWIFLWDCRCLEICASLLHE